MWNYLIITASNDAQAAGYRAQLDLRQQLGLLPDVEHVRVVADPGGKRIGSGGSTLFCLMTILQEQGGSGPQNVRSILSGLRILIIHAGGDSKRLPAYGPCGKIFVPVPGDSDSGLPVTLFDRQVPTYLNLPAPPAGRGQVVITSGDVMLRFDPHEVCFDRFGLTGLGCFADPLQAANYGVYGGVDDAGRVKRFLQKPTPAQQQAMGATDPYGQSILDIGVMHFDAATAVRLLEIFGAGPDAGGHWQLSSEMGRAVMEQGLDFYREICCGMGSEVTRAHHLQMARGSGSTWNDVLLGRLLHGLEGMDFNLQLLKRCDFIDFGTTRHMIQSGTALLQQDTGAPRLQSCLDINNLRTETGQFIGSRAWVEGCRITAPLTLGGDNVVCGLDIDQPLTLPPRACIDVIAGDGAGWFVRCYSVDDTFKENIRQNAAMCGIPLLDWLQAVGAAEEDVFDSTLEPDRRSAWQARLFPAVTDPGDYRNWLWMFDPSSATDTQRACWRSADRYSLAHIAEHTDAAAFFQRRLSIRAEQIKHNLRKMFRHESEFSAAELGQVAAHTADRSAWVAALVSEAQWHSENSRGLEGLSFPRLIHTLAAVVEGFGLDSEIVLQQALPDLAGRFSPAVSRWLDSVGLPVHAPMTVGAWIQRARTLAFEALSSAILYSGSDHPKPPVCALRSDEIVWGRAPARFDTGGGWTDTPPYSLEYGGCVVNAAVDLNGQPPIQVYLRRTQEPAVTIGSIDLGTRIRITELDQLLDYRSPTSQYGLVKAALALSGFSPQSAAWPDGVTLPQMLAAFGGGFEITTLAAIPKGSGLGTSSIMGAVILAVIHRAMNQDLNGKQLFNRVLQLEQALTTGGGWQDQVGGVVGGVKIVSTEPGLIPDPCIHYLPADILDPTTNGGTTLLYYTGITRLAKNILEQVVGRYLDRNRRSMATLRKIDFLTAEVSDALSRKDLPAFGGLVQRAWELNKQLDPNSTNEDVEKLFDRVAPYIHGAKLLGAGGGGFMLMICKSLADAQTIRQMLNADPTNGRARFFDYAINPDGLVVTVC